jgi:CrcB protein
MARGSVGAALSPRLTPAGATLCINLLGSFLIGIVLAASALLSPQNSGFGLIWASVGFLGGFTTVSGFALHVLEFSRSGRARAARSLALGTVAGGVALAYAGQWLGAPLLGAL